MNNERKPDHRTAVWRWIFLCCETSLITLLVVENIQSYCGYRYIDDLYHPIGAWIVKGIEIGTCLFLLFVSPFFFRRLGILAVISWLSALVSVGVSGSQEVGISLLAVAGVGLLLRLIQACRVRSATRRA